MSTRLEPRLVGKWQVLSPRGGLDLATAPALRAGGLQALMSADDIVVDLSAVELMDSVALGVLLGLDRRCRDRGGELRIVVVAPAVRRVFEVTRTDRLLTLFGDLDAALA